MAELVGIIYVTITLMFLHARAHDVARSPLRTRAHWIEPRVNRYSLESAQGYRQEFPKLPFLDQIFENYDRRAWPTLGSPLPTEVTVYVDVYDMGPLDSSNMDYGLDAYLEQSWLDPRLNLLRFGINETLMLSGETLTARLWKPDLFFVNAKDAAIHSITAPNELVKIDPDGTVLYGVRVRLKLSCRMDFRLFPLDKQRCPMIIRPYAQKTGQTRISWALQNPLTLEFEIQMEEFDLVEFHTGAYEEKRLLGSFSCLNATFVLYRRIHYHLIQSYFPTCLAVFISWVAFYITIHLPQIRFALGVVTLFTVLSIASSIRATMPRVTYVKVIDVWITACIIFIFAELAETTLVNYLIRVRLRPAVMRRVDFGIANLIHHMRYGYPTDDFLLKMDASSKLELHRNVKRAEAIDRASRYLFPLCFAFFNLVYWLYYSAKEYEVEYHNA